MIKKKILPAKSWQNRILRSAEAALVIVDLNPFISEPIRFGTLLGSQTIFHNVIISALCFGGITLLLDGLGAFATADLLESDTATATIKRINSLLKKMNLTRLLNAKTNTMSDIGITLLVGTPIALILKQKQDTARRFEDNAKLGILLSAVASVISIFQGGAIVAGIWQTSVVTVVLAVLSIISILAIGNRLNKYLLASG